MGEAAEAPLFEDVKLVRERVAAGLAGVDRLVAVMSGKGGVGKSAVAVNLAAALARRSLRVGLLDADLHGPSLAKMLGLRGQPVRVAGDGALEPAVGPLGLRVQSMDFFLQGNQPLDWEGERGEGAALRGAMEQAALADLLGRTAWRELDLLLLDLAPGSDRLPALAGWLPARLGALAVTIPSEVATLAVERSLRRAYAARVPLIGLVENLASATCAHCGAEAPLYPASAVDRLARDLSIPRLARIPFDPELAAAADAGRLPAPGPGPCAAAFAALAESVAAWQPPEEPAW